MKEFELKYGCNPNQKPARIYMRDGSDLPIEILSGRPGYINFLAGDRSACRHLFQACQSYFGCCRSSDSRKAQTRLLCR